MNTKILAASAMLLFGSVVIAQENSYPKAKVSFNDFKNLVAEVETHREKRLIDLNTFLKMSKESGVIILDTRSTFRYERIHVKGAKHLSFTDFTQNNLAEVIPSFQTIILIYCNNNFDGDQTDFASKVALPITRSGSIITAQFNSQEKPLMMALNIPTYINLYGYGYHNVYELNELVNVNDPRINFEGSIVEQSEELIPRLIEKK
ncbi:MAG: rhodanese-like domain-containing protein [Ignavibacteriaceae bacterium]|nr:rhodanese-like domain-containing protein [Ignavibacteriaceae bacterium]